MHPTDDSLDTLPTLPDTRALSVGEKEAGRPLLIAMSGKHLGELFTLEEGECLLGRSSSANLRLEDEGISRRHALIREVNGAYFIEDLKSQNGTFVNGEAVTVHRLEAGDKVTLGRGTVLKFQLCDPLDEAFHRRLLSAALRDGLTQLYNKRYIMQRLNDELSFALRHGGRLSLLFIDLDNFKPINDACGHLVGDEVLQSVARLIESTARAEDVVGRYGGDEFVVLCRHTDETGAKKLAERLRRAIDEASFTGSEQAFSVTASVGYASYPKLQVKTADELLEAADRALYAAKSSGRNTSYSALPTASAQDT